MTTVMQDLRFALRNVSKSRALTAVAMATLAIGIGANTAIFSIVNGILLRPLPFRSPEQLVRLYETEAAPGKYPFAGPDFVDWKAQNTTFQDMTMFSWPQDTNMSGEGRPDHVLGVPTEANFFSLLGVRAYLGRTFAPGEDQAGRDQVVVLSYPLWRSRFAGDPGVLGRLIELNGKKHTIIGVMPASFHFPPPAQFWTPLDMDAKTLRTRGSHWASAIGRMKPGVPVAKAQAELKVIAAGLRKRYPDSNDQVGGGATPLQEEVVGDFRNSLLVMLGAVGLVLLIGCANVANLLLVRAIARQKEMAIRSALGAARRRLVRQLLTESLVLSVSGGALGVLLAAGLVRLFAGLKSIDLAQLSSIQLDWYVLGFALALAVGTGILFGIIPGIPGLAARSA